MHLLRSILFALTLVMVGTLNSPAVHAECDDPSATPLNDGYCLPSGDVYCGNGESCDAGEMCIGNGKCAAEGSIDCGDHWCSSDSICTPDSCAPLGSVLCNSGGYCDAGNRCTSNGGCAPENTQDCENGFAPIGSVCCSGGGHCNAGFICGTGDECISSSSSRICSNGSYCDAGSVCGGDGQCRSAQSQAPPPPPDIDWNQFIPPPSPPPEPDPPKQEPLVEPSDEDPPPQETAGPQPEEKKEPPPPPVVELNVKGMTIPSGEGTGSLSCSTISGLPDSGGSSGGDCAGKAKWTKAEPYNHAKQPVTFTPFYGQPVPIPFGFSLWSVFDSDAPASRRLESRPWNGNPHDINSMCAVEHLNAVSQGDFQVSLECESKRQLALEQEFNETFATREERNGYRDREKCKSPLKIKDNPGWKDRPLSWWRQNTGQPTGWCMNGSRVEFPVRQPGWRSIKDCDILRSTGTVGPIVTNKRGVRGCKDKD